MREQAAILLMLAAAGSFSLPAVAQAQNSPPLDQAAALIEEIEEASTHASTPAQNRRDRAAAAAAFALGQRHEAKGDFPLARDYYEAAHRADPGYLPIIIRLTFLDFRVGRYQDGLARLEAALRLTQQRATLHSLMAFAHLQMGRPDLAEAEARRSLEADPALAANYRILAALYRDRSELDRIDQLVPIALDSTITTADAWIRLGETFEQILAHQPETERATAIRPFFERAAALDPQSVHAHLRLGETALRAGDFGPAADALARALQLEPRLANARQQLAYALLAADRKREAAEILDQIIQDNPAATEVYPLLVELLEELGNYAMAAERLETWIALNPPDPLHHTELVHLHLRAEKPAEALKAANRALEKFPSSPHLHLLRGFALRQEKKHEESLLAFRRAESLAAGDDDFLTPFFYFELGATCELAGEFEEAQRLFQKVLAMDQDHHLAMNYLGYMWAERNINLAEAEKLIERALEFDHDNPAYLDSLGWVYFQQGRYAESRTYLERALKGLPNDPVILDHYGDVLQKLGLTNEAVAAWEKAAQFADDPEPIRAKINNTSRRVTLSRPAAGE